MNASTTPPSLLVEDIETYNQLLQPYRQECVQLSKGSFSARVSGKQTHGINLRLVQLQQSMHIVGESPTDHALFCIPLEVSDSIYWRGGKYGINYCGGIAERGHYELVTPNVYAATTLEIEVALFRKQTEYAEFAFLSEIIDSEYPVKFDTQKYRRLIHSIWASPNLPVWKKGQEAESNVTTLLFQLADLIDPLDYKKYYFPKAQLKKNFRIRDFMHFLSRNYHSHLSVDLIANELHTSRATLQRTIQAGFGLSVNEIVKIYRLNLLRKHLQQNTEQRAKIGDLGKRFGFWHLGNMAKDYYEFFGHLPSHEKFFRNGRRKFSSQNTS